MSKLPMETRPLRLPPDIERAVEAVLRPLTGKKLEAAQKAVLKVYQSKQSLDAARWIVLYGNAIADAVREPVPA